MISKKALWKAQLREWPESIRIKTPDMIDWIYKVSSSKKHSPEHLWITMTMCMQYQNGVFYRTSDRLNAHVGFRFGIKGSEYVSGFPLWNGKFGC
jgi:hypothetical protein